MARRYLTQSEAESALSRGKATECFLGACVRDGKPGIRWLSARVSNEGFTVSVYESANIRSAEFTDVYEFGPLDPELEFEDPVETFSADSFSKLTAELERRFFCCTERLVNEFVIQDEYADYLAQKRS
ncbi:hypothetical protein JOD69_004971 [Methylocaldum sp. RMAD-M]|nr:hypothetical protein [Methylocaldum sp. RMAD-M]